LISVDVFRASWVSQPLGRYLRFPGINSGARMITTATRAPHGAVPGSVPAFWPARSANKEKK
jgi:hypothetical protein